MAVLWANIGDFFANLWAKIVDEPVVMTTFVGAIIDLGIVFGAPITNDQKVAIVVAVTAGLALFARSKVTPTSKLP